MTGTREEVVIVAADSEWRRTMQGDLEQAGYDVSVFESSAAAAASLHAAPPQVLLVDLTSAETPTHEASHNIAAADGPANPANDFHEMLPSLKGSAETVDIRVVVLAEQAAERATIIDLGADAVLSPPWDRAELLARVRGQLRARREIDDLRQKVAIAEQGQQIAHTAFEALAVTEKMTKDAFSLGRALKLTLIGICVAAALMAVIFFLFSHNATKQMKLANAAIGRLERGVIHQGDLIVEARKLRSEGGIAGVPSASGETQADSHQDLQQKADALKQQMATSDASSIPGLQKQLAETNARLQRVENQRNTAQDVITSDVASVCLLHVAVAFRDKDSGARIRYAGINPQGEPLQDSDGHPIYTVEGRGPEVRLDGFGTGFLAGPGGRALTNRHVAQPWWKDDDLSAMISQGVQPEISSITAYFPGNAAAMHAEIEKISAESDLASVQIALDGLSRPVLPIDAAKNAAISGQSVISIGYATGLAAILARADEDTVQKIMKDSGGDVAQILDDLSRRALIHPLITQGHIGDVLEDKIVFDAQTSRGGSGGPLLNRDGKVIGVTFAILSGFGGSNFGIPIRFSGSLLSAAPKQ